MRWQLTEPHYLNVPGTKWEQQIQDRITGRQVRKSFTVPMHLHPESDVDWNRMDGQQGLITICHQGKGHPDGRDIVFVGPKGELDPDPTPGMLPLDDEARELSSKFSWTPTQGVDDVSQSNSFANQMLNGLIKDMAELQAGVRSAPQAEGLGELIATMREMMQTQMQMFQMMMAKQAAPAPVVYDPSQHVVDDEEPIEDASEPTEEEIAEAEEAARVLEAESQKRAAAVAASGKTVPPRMRRG